VDILKTSFRLYVSEDAFDATVEFYEALLTISCERRLSFPEIKIEVAVIGAFIVVSGSEEALRPFRHVQAALIVDSLDACAEKLRKLGATSDGVIHENAAGRNMTFRHPDGLFAEYFEPAIST
jgi:hypothetical protein